MASPKIEKLLVLQARDQNRNSVEVQLRAVPRDIAAVEERIAAEKAAFESARGELRELEAKKKSVETEIGAAEERLSRYKSQQVEVRKNDEYQALGVQIARTQAEVGGFEEDELKVMYAIDDARRRSAAAEAELKRNIAGHEERIRTLRARGAAVEAELKEAQEASSAARAGIDEAALRLYDRLAAKPGLPAVVAIRDSKCEGCHLKISWNIESEARKGDKLVTCDQCGRIVYWDGGSPEAVARSE